jgi:hypothetical protein
MLFSKIEAGIVTGVSVGYSIERFEEIESDDEIPTFLATRWTPFEISAVPMPADLGAGYRSNRDGAEHYAARACAVQMRGLDEIPLTDAWIDQRTAHIHDTGIREAVIAEGRAMVKRGATTKEFIEMSTKRLADEDDKIQTRNHLVVGDDRNELARRAGIVNAIVHSVDPREALSSEGREFRGRTLVEMARICVEATGVRTAGMSRTEVVGTAMGFQQRAGGAHSTSDFPFLLADAAGKFLLRAYKEGMGGLIAIARPTTAPDFKTQKKLQLSEAPALLRVPEGAEITRGTVGESQESYALATFARIFSITRQAIYNDDRGAFERMPSQFGRAARDLERDLLTAALLSTTPMFDADPLFHVDHKNTGTGALGVPALSAARTAMRLQTHINGTLISVDPTYLIVPAALETLGEQILTELQVSSVSEANPFSRRLKLVVEPRLDADDPEIWYLAADSGQIDTLEICRLEGEEEPFFESKIDFDTDALSLKARHDCAAAAVDWRGLYMSDGQVVEP